jgi:4-amino-4-deoxy-L-arabinose transferase-like glycosyltransferase
MLFLSISLYQLRLPGLYYDEALDFVPMLQAMHGEQPELLRGIGIAGYPIMLLDYMGSLNGYLTIPFMALFGSGVVAARLQPIFFSAVTIVLSYALANRWFGRGVAAVTVLLLAVNPSFIWFSRQGISVTSVMAVFSLGSLLLLDSWIQRTTDDRRPTPDAPPSAIRRAPSLWRPFCAGLLIGLGLWAKFLFLRWIVVLVVMGLVFLFTRRSGETERPSVRARLVPLSPGLLVLIGGLFIGAFPLIYYNFVGLVRDGSPHTLTLLLSSLAQPTQQFGVNNLDFFANIQKSIDDVRVFVDGSYFWYNGIPFSNVFAAPALLISAGLGSVLAIIRATYRQPIPDGRGREEARCFFAILTSIAVLIVLGAFTVSGLWATHQFIMLPLPQLVIACASVWSAESIAYFVLRRGPNGIRNTQYAILTGVAVCALLAVPFTRDLWVSQRHHEQLAKTGGAGRFSDAIYKLATYLDSQGIDAPVALDWGIEKNVRILTNDRVRPVEVFGFASRADETFKQRTREMLQDPSRQYIVLWDRFAVYNRRRDFTQIANEMGRQVVEAYIAHEKSGLPVYVVLQAK